jgi:hypothetical protein
VPGATLDRAAAEAWIRGHVEPAGAIQAFRQRPWASVLRVPLARGAAWFKACAPVQAFEPSLTARLYARWPDRVPEVLGHDETRAWVLLADAGTPVGELGNPPEVWAEALPRYAELQRGETSRVPEHLAGGVPDLRPTTWPARYGDLAGRDLPLTPGEAGRLREFAPGFAELCARLEDYRVPDSIQHDDLHTGSLYRRGTRLRVLDWGDASVSHPFVSLVVTFRFLEEVTRLPPGDRWYARLRDAYAEPWGRGLAGACDLAVRVGAFVHAFAWARQRDALTPEELPGFDAGFAIILRRALARTGR